MHTTTILFLGIMTFFTSMALSAESNINMDKNKDWELIWQDEFNGNGKPDSAKWSYETGMLRNNEAQCYTDRGKNCFQKNGYLNIIGIKEEFKLSSLGMGNAKRSGKDKAEYTSASIYSNKSFLYGRIEVKAKIPTGKGSWPAIWTLGENLKKVGWPKCGEIDVMENVGKNPDSIHGTLHFFSKEKKKHEGKGKGYVTAAPFKDFHIYAVEWDEKKIDFFYDETKYFSVELDTIDPSAENPFRKPQFIKLNLALGGSWGGKIDDTILPLNFEIDYIRVYQKKPQK